MLKTEEQRQRYEDEIDRIYKQVPKGPKHLRKGRKDLMKNLNKLWETAINHSESFGGEDLKVQAATKEEYRSNYMKWMVPLLIAKGFPLKNEAIPSEAWVMLAKALLVQEGIDRSRHLIYTRVWGFHRILYPMANSTEQRKVYLENFKSLMELIDPLELERGIELDCLIIMAYKLTKSMSEEERKKAAGVRIDRKARETIMEGVGLDKRAKLETLLKLRQKEKEITSGWRELEKARRQRRQERRAREEMIKRRKGETATSSTRVGGDIGPIATASKNLNSTAIGLQKEGKKLLTDEDGGKREEREEIWVRPLDKERKKPETKTQTEKTIEKEILGQESETSSVLSPDSDTSSTEQELSLSVDADDSDSGREQMKGRNHPKRAAAGQINLTADPMLGEQVFKCEKTITMAEFLKAMMLAFWSFMRPGEWKDVELEDVRDPLGVGEQDFRRVVFTSSKGQRAGSVDVLEMRCSCGDYKREEPEYRMPVVCTPCPVHCIESEVWDKVKKVSPNKKSKMVIELWAVMGWPTDGRSTQHILHLLRIGAAMTAGSGVIQTQLVMAYGRWKSLEMAIYYEKMSGRVPGLVAVKSWPVRRAILLDEEDITLDEVIEKLIQAKITFPLGRSMREVATQRRRNKEKMTKPKPETKAAKKDGETEGSALDKIGGRYGPKTVETSQNKEGSRKPTTKGGLINMETQAEPDRIRWPETENEKGQKRNPQQNDGKGGKKGKKGKGKCIKGYGF